MPSNQTTNYQLSQWAKSDQVKMEDFNADNAKIDGALASQAAALAGLTAASPKHGNCQIYSGGYQGTGTYGQGNPNTLTFACRPLLVFVINPNGAQMCLQQGNPMASFGSYEVFSSWSGNTVSWYSSSMDRQLNYSGFYYRWVALCSKD